MTDQKSPLATYDFLGWAKHRLAIAQAEHDSPYCRGAFYSSAIETWTEVIARIEAGDALGLYACAEVLPGLAGTDCTLLRYPYSENPDDFGNATDEGLVLGWQFIPAKSAVIRELLERADEAQTAVRVTIADEEGTRTISGVPKVDGDGYVTIGEDTWWYPILQDNGSIGCIVSVAGSPGLAKTDSEGSDDD